MGLSDAGPSSPFDIAKGIVRVPNNVVQYKLLGSIIAPVKEIVKERRRVLSESEDEIEDKSEDESANESSDESEPVNGFVKGGTILGSSLITLYLIKRRWTQPKQA